VRGIVAVTIGAIAAASCGKSGLTDADADVNLRAVTTAPAIGTLASFVYSPAGLTGVSYPGTFAGQPSTFARLDDSTVSIVVPAVAAGAVDVEVQIGSVVARTTLTVAPAEQIADPEARVIDPIDQFVETALHQPQPAVYDAAWTTDSALTAKYIADGKQAWQQLSAAERVEVARLISSGPAAAGANFAETTQAECAAIVTSFTKAFGEARLMFDAWETSASGLKKVVVAATAATKYMYAIMQAGLVSQRCTFYKDFQLSSQPAASPGSDFQDMSLLTITAGKWRRTIPRDPSTNPLSAGLAAARRGLEAIGEMLNYTDAFTNEQYVQVEPSSPVDPDLVSLATTQTSAGVSVGYMVFQDAFGALKPAVTVLSTLKAQTTATLTFKVKNNDFGSPPEASFSAPVTLPPVCYEGAKKYRGCVEVVEVTAGKSPIVVGYTSAFTVKTWDQFGTQVVRDMTWTSLSADASVNAATGLVTGVHAAKVATIRATAHSGKSNTASLEIYNPVKLTVSGTTMAGTNTQTTATSNGSTFPAGRKQCNFAWSGIATGGGKGTVLKMDWTQTSSKGSTSGTTVYNVEFQEGPLNDDGSWWWVWGENNIPVYIPFTVTIVYTYRDDTSGEEKTTVPVSLNCT
jgi:hypothetical protein